jgi:hypothetical protein
MISSGASWIRTGVESKVSRSRPSSSGPAAHVAADCGPPRQRCRTTLTPLGHARLPDLGQVSRLGHPWHRVAASVMGRHRFLPRDGEPRLPSSAGLVRGHSGASPRRGVIFLSVLRAARRIACIHVNRSNWYRRFVRPRTDRPVFLITFAHLATRVSKAPTRLRL